MKEKIIRNIRNRLFMNGIDLDVVETVMSVVIEALHSSIIYEDVNATAYKYEELDDVLMLFRNDTIIRGLSENTAYAYERTVRRICKDLNKSVTSIEVSDIRYWLLMRQQNVSAVSVENDRSNLSSFFSWMHEEGLIEKNPMAGIKPIKVQKELKIPFSEVEIDQIRSACTTLRHRAIVEVLLSSGVRVSELCNLKKSDVNFDTNRIRVIHGKGGKSRITYMNDVAKEHLLRYLESRDDDVDYLFTTRLKQQMSKGCVRYELTALGELANVHNVHPHRFRRTFATTLSRNGASIEHIQALMGHSDINTTRCYITLDDNILKNVYNKYI